MMEVGFMPGNFSCRCLLLVIASVLCGSAGAESYLLTDRIFSPDSFWYGRIPEAAPQHPQSARLVKELLSQINTGRGRVNINYKAYSSPVYFAAVSTSRVTVSQWNCQNKKSGFPSKRLAEHWQSVPIPADARPSAGSDAEMTIYERNSDTVWEFWRARRIDGKWSACWGGRISDASKNNGYFDGAGGATATGLPFLGGQITAEELLRGEIRHVIGIAVKRVASRDVFYWPAQRSDGGMPANMEAQIPEGARFRLSPSVNVDELPMGHIGKVIAKAAQQYGFVVWDKAAAVSIRAQNILSYDVVEGVNVYDSMSADFPDTMRGFPWDKVEFLPPNYGKADLP